MLERRQLEGTDDVKQLRVQLKKNATGLATLIGSNDLLIYVLVYAWLTLILASLCQTRAVRSNAIDRPKSEFDKNMLRRMGAIFWEHLSHPDTPDGAAVPFE